MKVGLFTYHFSDNYGALFQAYSLREWLRRRGLDAEFVNYHPTYVEEGGPFVSPWRLALWRKNATIMYIKIAHLRRRLFGDRAQHAGFEHFRKEILGVNSPRLYRAGDLTSEMGQYDMLVCGSDQIWNPSVQRGIDPVYFLDIPGADHARKVSFAPSFGRDEIEPDYYDTVCRLSSKLDGLSVREASGLNILEASGLTQKRARVMPDPTILLGRFENLVGDQTDSNNSVFCYALRTDATIREVATEVALLTGGQIRSPRTTHQRWRDIGEGIVPSPVEWLRLLASAQTVVSNSFHGVALSLILNRPFIAVSLPGKRAKMNARVQNLLTIAGLSHRIVDTFDSARIHALVNSPIDWEAVNERLKAVRAEAEVYLDEQIEAATLAHKEAVR